MTQVYGVLLNKLLPLSGGITWIPSSTPVPTQHRETSGRSFTVLPDMNGRDDERTTYIGWTLIRSPPSPSLLPVEEQSKRRPVFGPGTWHRQRSHHVPLSWYDTTGQWAVTLQMHENMCTGRAQPVQRSRPFSPNALKCPLLGGFFSHQ